MKQNDIDSFLRANKPHVKDNPAFLLEVQQKMRAVDGIKAEVDSQRRQSHVTLVVTLFAGMLIGALAISFAYLFPIDTDALNNGIISEIRLFLESYKQYVLLLIAACAISLGIIFCRQKTGYFKL